MSEVFEVSVEPGTSINMAATELCIAARAHGHATMTFNDVPLYATPNTRISDVLAEWDEIQRSRELERDRKRQAREDAFQEMALLLRAIAATNPTHKHIGRIRAVIEQIDSDFAL